MKKQKYILLLTLVAVFGMVSGAFAAGDWVPRADGTQNIGSSSKAWGKSYVKTNTLENGEQILNGTDGTVQIIDNDDDVNLIVDFKTTATNAGTVTVILTADAKADAGDMFALKNDGAGTLSIQSDVSSAGTLADKITITSAGAVTLPTALSVGTFFGTSVGTATVTNGGTLTATASYMRVDTSGETATLNATTSIANGATDGDLLRVQNIGTNDLVLKDAGNLIMSGDRTMAAGLFSTTDFVWDASQTNWISTGESDN